MKLLNEMKGYIRMKLLVLDYCDFFGYKIHSMRKKMEKLLGGFRKKFWMEYGFSI